MKNCVVSKGFFPTGMVKNVGFPVRSVKGPGPILFSNFMYGRSPVWSLQVGESSAELDMKARLGIVVTSVKTAYHQHRLLFCRHCCLPSDLVWECLC